MPKGRPKFENRIIALEERVVKLEEKLNSPVLVAETSPMPVAETPPIPAFVPPAVDQGAPVPVDFRLVVNDILNRHFDIRITPRADSPQFEFGIVVPEKYSSLRPVEKELIKEDLRIKVLGYADGVAGVREWSQRVYDSFNQEVKAQIVADRL